MQERDLDGTSASEPRRRAISAALACRPGLSLIDLHDILVRLDVAVTTSTLVDDLDALGHRVEDGDRMSVAIGRARPGAAPPVAALAVAGPSTSAPTAGTATAVIEPPGPAVDPTAPAADPLVPEVQPLVPEVDPAVPTVDPADPDAEPAGPALAAPTATVTTDPVARGARPVPVDRRPSAVTGRAARPVDAEPARRSSTRPDSLDRVLPAVAVLCVILAVLVGAVALIGAAGG